MGIEPSCCIEELNSRDPCWQELVDVITEEGQAKAAFDPFFARFPRYFVAARQNGRVVGFLMFVVWEIGPHDRGHPRVERNGMALTEAKIIAFGVPAAHRRRGIGRALQEHVLSRARALGCHQVRSVSRWSRQANHQLKLSMGFAVEPMERDEPSLAFVMPLDVNGSAREGGAAAGDQPAPAERAAAQDHRPAARPLPRPLTTSNYAKLVRCSNDTALRDIRDLLARAIIVRNSGRGRNTSYRLQSAPPPDQRPPTTTHSPWS